MVLVPEPHLYCLEVWPRRCDAARVPRLRNSIRVRVPRGSPCVRLPGSSRDGWASLGLRRSGAECMSVVCRARAMWAECGDPNRAQ